MVMGTIEDKCSSRKGKYHIYIAVFVFFCCIRNYNKQWLKKNTFLFHSFFGSEAWAQSNLVPCSGTNKLLPRWRRQWHLTPVLLPGKSHGRRSLVGCSPWGLKESDTTERLHFHFSLLWIGEGNGNPPQCSCLENPMDRGAWWVTVHSITKNRTWLCDLACTHAPRYLRL